MIRPDAKGIKYNPIRLAPYHAAGSVRLGRSVGGVEATGPNENLIGFVADRTSMDSFSEIMSRHGESRKTRGVQKTTC